MTDLLSAWTEVSGRLKAAPHVLVLLDFDGTLVPIVERPSLAWLSEDGRRLLEQLRDLGRVDVGVVSGREIGDLLFRVAVEKIWYVGNHGFEFRLPSGEGVHFYEPEDTAPLKAVFEEIARATSGIPGVLLEPKGPVLAVHYRLVDPSRVHDVERAFSEATMRHQSRLQVGHGKAVFEARIRSHYSKGSAVRLIRRCSPSGSVPIYFGDDKTDQYAFREVRGTGMSVMVGNPALAEADYSLRDSAEVLAVLARIHDVLRQR
jgi:trehalose-phosphatase